MDILVSFFENREKTVQKVMNATHQALATVVKLILANMIHLIKTSLSIPIPTKKLFKSTLAQNKVIEIAAILLQVHIHKLHLAALKNINTDSQVIKIDKTWTVPHQL